jgi:hypothetical protein
LGNFFELCCGRNAIIAFIPQKIHHLSFRKDGVYTTDSSTCNIAAAYGKRRLRKFKAHCNETSRTTIGQIWRKKKLPDPNIKKRITKAQKEMHWSEQKIRNGDNKIDGPTKKSTALSKSVLTPYRQQVRKWIQEQLKLWELELLVSVMRQS